MNNLKEASSTFNFIKDILKFTISRFFSAIVMISIGVITARLLEPEGRGYYALFFSITGMIATFSHLGIAQSNIYELNKRHTLISNLIGNNLNYLCLMCLLIICFLVISFFIYPLVFYQTLIIIYGYLFG